MVILDNNNNVFSGFFHRSFFVTLFYAAIAFGTEMQSGDTKQSAVGFQKTGRVVLPINQVLTPAGRQVELPLMRPQVIKLSPDGQILVTSGKTPELIVLDPSGGRILQRVMFPSASADSHGPNNASSHKLELDKKAQVSYTGLVFSPDSKRIYLSNVNSDIKVFSVEADQRVYALYSIPLPPMDITLKGHQKDIPAGLAISADGTRLYVALNISNQLLELDLITKKALRYFDVGVCPYTVSLAVGKAYVSNWGGSRPDDSSVTGPIGVTGRVRVDPVRFIANQGSVSIIDLVAGKTKTEIQVGLHASVLELTKNGQYLLVANSASDTLSIIDTAADKIIETIDMNWHTGDLSVLSWRKKLFPGVP